MEVVLARSDIIVLGAGIVGTSIALSLVKRGLAVTLIDRSEPGQGTSYGMGIPVGCRRSISTMFIKRSIAVHSTQCSGSIEIPAIRKRARANLRKRCARWTCPL
jgi:2-polyprenyl-6-methoxyphenol hydroxylase-like FAD-dependent oxidoreductase